MPSPATVTALLHGPDRPGIVADVATHIAKTGGNILHADQHRDAQENVFTQRIEWAPQTEAQAATDAEAFNQFASTTLGMSVQIALSTDRPRIAIFCSQIPHCLQDILLRWKDGELPGEIACVISNHQVMRPFVESFGLPFHHIPVTAETKAQAEAQQATILRDNNIQLAVLARYMQILSGSLIEAAGCPIINIHHSFLPAFAGGKPYHQAYARGVKLIGATAHYVTEKLDEGPIIAQNVTHISHRNTVPDLVRKGRELERIVFAQAIRWHLENRVLAYNNKTVVFD